MLTNTGGEMSHDEFFSEMRMQGVEHLGQVRVGLLETTGDFSLLLYPHDQVRYGLPLFPKQYKLVDQINANEYYACMYCGYVDKPLKVDQPCGRCQNKCIGWAKAINIVKTELYQATFNTILKRIKLA
ncbi:hypothetical protein [Moraxella osloensis]|uniref:hypothetical protein n=1 Tax=Faucicola osloensis TaxID=34062 RepID=UPI0018F1F0B6